MCGDQCLCCKVYDMCQTPIVKMVSIERQRNREMEIYRMRLVVGSNDPFCASICLENSCSIVLLFDALSQVT